MGEAVVRLVPADLFLELAHRGVFVDDEKLGFGEFGEVAEDLDTHGRRHHGVVRGARRQPARRRGRKVGRGLPHCTSHGKVRQVGSGDVLDDVGDEAEPVAHVAHRDDDGRAGVGREDQAHRVVLAADAERVDLEAGLLAREGRRDFEHVGTEDLLVAGNEVVGVVLHEARTAGQSLAHDVCYVHEDRGLPVALGAEAVALGHEALDGEPRQLLERTKVFEARREGAEAASFEEGAQSHLDRRAIAQRLVALTAATQLGNDLVELLVLGDEGVHLLIGCRRDGIRELVDAPRVHLHAEADLSFGLVALGDGDVTHVVTEASQLERTDRGKTRGGALPRLDLALHGGVGHVPDDGLAGHAQARLDVPELPVAVGGLVEVHEVEVDLAPRQFDVGLRVEVQQRLLQRVEATDPHLGGAEGVHPGDDPDDLVPRVHVEGEATDAVGILEHGFPHDADGELRKPGDDGLGLLGDLTEGLFAVEVLAAGDEPDLAGGERIQGSHEGPSSMRVRARRGR